MEKVNHRSFIVEQNLTKFALSRWLFFLFTTHLLSLILAQVGATPTSEAAN